LQNSGSKYSGYLRNALFRLVPVSIGVALADDVERLQQRHAGLHHRRQLAGEQGDVLAGDLLAAAVDLLLDLGDHHALAAQGDVDHGLATGAQFPAHGLAGFVLAFPGVDVFLDLRGAGFR
jgi:hypothetical protein